MPVVDPRYGSIKVLIESGHVRTIKEIFLFIPKTTVYKDLGVNFNRFDRAILNPYIFRLQELFDLAKLIGVEAKKLLELACAQIDTNEKQKKRK